MIRTRRSHRAFYNLFLLSEACFRSSEASECPAAEIRGQSWLNSEPLRLAQLRNGVILVEFWTFGCYNCRNVQPHIKAWRERYADKGLVVIGVHSPEFDYERVLANVQCYVREHAI